MRRPALFLALLLCASPVVARDAMGIFGAWGAFRDAGVPRCYAIAMANPPRGAINGSAREAQPYADIGFWPKRAIRGALHARLSHRVAAGAPIQLALAGQKFALAGGGLDAWSADARMDAAIIAAMRSGESMTIASRDSAGRLFSDAYALSGAATAMDAAMLACAGR